MREVYPIPKAKSVSTRYSSVQSLLTCLLIPNQTVQVQILNFIKKNYCDKFTYRALISVKGFYEILVATLFYDNASKLILTIFLKIYNFVVDDLE